MKRGEARTWVTLQVSLSRSQWSLPTTSVRREMTKFVRWPPAPSRAVAARGRCAILPAIEPPPYRTCVMTTETESKPELRAVSHRLPQAAGALAGVFVGPSERHRPDAGRLFCRRACAAGRPAGRGQDAAGPDAGRPAVRQLPPHSIHVRPDAGGRHRHVRDHGVQGRRRFEFQQGRSSPTCCWPTRSTAPRRRPRPPCSKPWRKAR